MLLGQISKELKRDKELRQQPRLTRGIYWTVISLGLFIFWALLLYKYSGHLGAPEVLGLLSAFWFLGAGVREFVKYRRSLVRAERGDESLSPATPRGSILNLTSGETGNRKASPSTPQPVPVNRVVAPSVTEFTTQHLEPKDQTHKEV